LKSTAALGSVGDGAAIYGERGGVSGKSKADLVTKARNARRASFAGSIPAAPKRQVRFLLGGRGLARRDGGSIPLRDTDKKDYRYKRFGKQRPWGAAVTRRD